MHEFSESKRKKNRKEIKKNIYFIHEIVLKKINKLLIF